MGYVEIYNPEDNKWQALEDVPMFDTVNCQLCNEPTEAQDISAKILIRDGVPIVGSWQCKKCHAVNG
jgi:hypothetical protein